MPEVWYLKEIRDRDRTIRKQGKEIEKLKEENENLRRENEHLEEALKQQAEAKKAKKPRFPDYSVRGQERAMNAERKTSPGRTPKERKGEPDEVRDIYPTGLLPAQCTLSHTRYVTHIQDGRKHVILYRVHKRKWSSDTAPLPGAMPRGEYGIEVAVTLAFLVYVIEVSIRQAQDILLFFTGIELSDSQADALLTQLSSLWSPEFEQLTTLVTLATIVHIDETGWKTGKERNYAWIFRTLSHAIFRFGQKRSEETLEQVLSREFPGIVITDFFSTYEKYFRNQQKCWAHLLRTIIRLMLLHPKKRAYKAFFEDLYALFTEAKAIREDATLTGEERQEKVVAFQERIRVLCRGCQRRMPKVIAQDVREFTNLKRRMLKHLDALFTFVLHPEVEPTNNRAEQGLRKTAKARNNYQTSKTKAGADRRSVLTSVLTSLQQNLPEFSLRTVIDEVTRWRMEGISLFERQVQAHLARASPA